MKLNKSSDTFFYTVNNNLLFKAFFQNTKAAIVVVDSDGNFIKMNQSFCGLIGYSENELLFMNIKDVTHPADLDVSMKKFSNLVKGKINSLEIEKRYVRKNRDVIWGYTSVSHYTDKENNSDFGVAMIQDITRLKTLEEKLKQNETRYRTVADYTYDWEYWIKPDGNIEYISPSCETITGYKPEEFQNNPSLISSIVHPLDKSSFFNHLSGEKEERVNSIDLRITTKDGSLKWIGHKCRAVYDDKGNFSGRRVSNRDITDEKNNQIIISENEKKYRDLFESSRDGIAILNLKGRFIECNRAFLELLGRKDVFELKNKKYNDIVRAKYRKDERKIFKEQVLKNGFSELNKKEYIRKDGNYIDVNIRKYLRKDTNNNPTGVWVIARDITLLKKNEEELDNYKYHLEKLVESRTKKLESANERIKNEVKRIKEKDKQLNNQVKFLKIITELLPAPTFIKDKDKKYIECNKAFQNLINLSRDEIIGKHDYELLSHEIFSQNKKIDDVLLMSGGYSRYVLKNTMNKKSDQDILTFKTAYQNNKGVIEGIIGVLIDITEQKKQEKEIQKLLEREKELNELKTEFISTVSHEFRTPLTAISLSAEILKMFNQDKNFKIVDKHLFRINKSVDKLVEMMENIITFNSYAKEKSKVNITEINLTELQQKIAGEIKPYLTANHRLVLKNSIENKKLCSDKRLLKLVLNNILSNAVKYSPGGGEILFELSSDEKFISFNIKDNGMGITEEDQKLLFTEFHRGSNADAIPGTGLGLSIVKETLNLLNGEINISSKPEKGTKVTIKLPENNYDQQYEKDTGY